MKPVYPISLSPCSQVIDSRPYRDCGPVGGREEALRRYDQIFDRRTREDVRFAIIQRQPADLGQGRLLGLLVQLIALVGILLLPTPV
jgi:hypothetical protein